MILLPVPGKVVSNDAIVSAVELSSDLPLALDDLSWIANIHSRFNISATGDVPTGRVKFCGGVSTAPDDSSFQITIYGGWNLLEGTVFNDVYTLTIPAFQWINVTPTNQNLGDGSDYGRLAHQCQVWQDSQMIVLGGQIMALNDINSTTGCDATHPPLLVLNTATYEWTNAFEPGVNYTQPSQVYNVIGGE